MQQLKGKFVKQAYSNGQYMVCFLTDKSIVPEYEGKELAIDVKTYRKDRSLDANAYYWVLVGKLAYALNQTQPWVHNDMIRKYGQPEMVDGKAVYTVIPDTEEAETVIANELKFHLRPTSQVKNGKDGKDYRTYILMRGSSTYNSKEFSALLNGLIEECKALNIQTLTPDELAQLKGYEKQEFIHRQN
jgi:hypothetical protein